MTNGPGHAPPPLSSAAWISIAAAGLFGASLRLFRLDQQVLTGDELHGLNGALARTPSEILSHWTYFGADYSVPLTLITRLALELGITVDETVLRLPILIAGIVTVCLLPVLWARHVGGRSAGLFAWLLAISPLLVLYGRIARSYAPALLLAWLAIVAFERAWRGRSRVASVAYPVCAALAVYLHLGTAPIVFTPTAWAAAGLLLRARGGGPEPTAGVWARLAWLSLGALAGLMVLLAPAATSLMELPGLQESGDLPGFAAWVDVVKLQAGTPYLAVALIVAVAAVRGFVLLARRDAELALLLVSLCGVHLLALAVMRPYLLESAVVVNRYIMFLLPGGLLLAAHGMAVLPHAASAWVVPAWRPGALAAVLLFALGPLPQAGFRKAVFAHSNPSVLFVRAPDTVPTNLVPAFYRELPRGDEGLLEYPAANIATHAFDAYQRLHGRPLVLGSINRLHADERLALRTLSPASPEAFRRSRARYVIVHLDLQQEEGAVVTHEFLHRRRLEEHGTSWSVLRAAGVQMAKRLEEEWGEPIYEDAQVRVWDTQAIGNHSERSPGERSPDLSIKASDG